MGYRISVIIPRDYLLVQMNVATPQDIALYEECIAFALSDRWSIDDIEFQILDDVLEHSFECTGGELLTAPPTQVEFSVALQEAHHRYRLMKTGIGYNGRGNRFQPHFQSWSDGSLHMAGADVADFDGGHSDDGYDSHVDDGDDGHSDGGGEGDGDGGDGGIGDSGGDGGGD